MIHVDASESIAKLRKIHKTLSDEQVKRATYLALNDARKKANTLIAKNVRQEYTVKSGQFKKNVRLTKASRNNLTATITIGGKAIPIDSFKARKVSKGVSIQIANGERKIIRGAFFAMINGRKRVMARGRYKENSFEFRNKRIKKTGNDLEINQLFSMSAALMAANHKTEIIENAMPIIQGTLNRRLEHFFDKISANIIK